MTDLQSALIRLAALSLILIMFKPPFLNLMSTLPLSSFINSKYFRLLVDPKIISVKIFAEII